MFFRYTSKKRGVYLQQSQHALLSWYEREGRHDLPWRNTEDIYAIYISEIMLQQTQVNRVKEIYYPQFLEKFPTLQSLGAVEVEEVLAIWSGLGYYSRAKNLHQTALLAGETLPSEYDALIELPGIGRYTASAICSFGYGQDITVVDTNIARVIKRFFALLEPKESSVWSQAELLLNHKDPRKHNLALMDLGSMICLPTDPKCSHCPLLKSCQGSATPKLYTQRKKKQYESLELFYGLWIRNDQVALTHSTGTMYKNMLELPRVDPIEESFIRMFKHSYTKYRLQVNLYKIEESSDELIWVDLDKLDEAPISSLTKKALKIEMTTP